MTWEWSEVEKSELWPGYAGRDSYRILNAMYAAAKSEDPVDQILSVFQQSWLVEDLLMKADKMSMAASLELRVPFLDHRLVEWANRQAIDVKLGRSGKDYVTKYVLRRFADKRLPGRIIDRPKRGFPVPVYDWVRDPEFGRWMRDHLLHKRSTLKNVFDSRRLEQHLDQAAVGSLRDAHKCWLLIVLETWCREWNVDLARAS
jgi:asparagine synthase (glutamine-hydrolysing)